MLPDFTGNFTGRTPSSPEDFHQAASSYGSNFLESGWKNCIFPYTKNSDLLILLIDRLVRPNGESHELETIHGDSSHQYLRARLCPTFLSSSVRRQPSLEVYDVLRGNVRFDLAETCTVASSYRELSPVQRALNRLQGFGVWTPITVDERTISLIAAASEFRRRLSVGQTIDTIFPDVTAKGHLPTFIRRHVTRLFPRRRFFTVAFS